MIKPFNFLVKGILNILESINDGPFFHPSNPLSTNEIILLCTLVISIILITGIIIIVKKIKK